jgi:hypothetical protein
MATKETRPGYKTSEFYLTAVAMVLSLLFASGLVSDGSTVEKVAAFLAAALTTLGYTVSRGKLKAGNGRTDSGGASYALGTVLTDHPDKP